MKTTLLLGIAGLLCFASCKNTEEVTKDMIETKVAEEAFDPTGYTNGTIVYSEEENDCEYTIQLKDGLFYDPVNLEDDYKQDGIAVYFKFSRLRMMNRCDKASPISLQEIHTTKK